MIGSFLNALIYRLPRNINVAFPRSSCPHCKALIHWYENIPILSFFFLKGRCASCGEKISIRYPLIELICGIASLCFAPRDFVTWQVGLELFELMYFFFFFSTFCAFLVHFLIDLEHKILPDSVNLYLLALFLVFSLWSNDYKFVLFGGAIGFGVTYLVTWGFYLLRGKIGLGGGDIKLFGVLGLYLGPIGVIHNIFLSCFLGALVGGGAILVKRMSSNAQLPFGPFIIVVASFQIFFPRFFEQFISLII